MGLHSLSGTGILGLHNHCRHTTAMWPQRRIIHPLKQMCMGLCAASVGHQRERSRKVKSMMLIMLEGKAKGTQEKETGRRRSALSLEYWGHGSVEEWNWVEKRVIVFVLSWPDHFPFWPQELFEGLRNFTCSFRPCPMAVLYSVPKGGGCSGERHTPDKHRFQYWHAS